MEELIIKMLICLLIALVIGFLFAWFLKGALIKEQYSPIIDKLEEELAQSKDELKISEEEINLIKEQFLHVDNELEVSLLKTTELEEKLENNNAKIAMFENTIEDRESSIDKVQQQNSLLQVELNHKEHELEKLAQKADSQDEMIKRLKEHHTLLKDELIKLQESKIDRDKEVEKLSIMIEQYKLNETKVFNEKKIQEATVEELKSSLNNYKVNELKLEDEVKAKKGKLVELESILNEKKISSLELKSKVSEIDTLKQKNSVLAEALKQREIKLKEKVLLSKSIHIKEDEKVIIYNKQETKSKGFTLGKFVKKALNYVPKRSETISRNGDKVIKEYKNR